MRALIAVMLIVPWFVLVRSACAQDPKDAVPAVALSCTMESPEDYRNHVVAVTISEQGKSATVNGRAARELQIEYLRFVILEEKIRWVIDRGTGRFSMFTTGAAAPTLYAKGACQLIKKRKF